MYQYNVRVVIEFLGGYTLLVCMIILDK